MVVNHFKCSSSLKQNAFWLADDVYIVHQLEKKYSKRDSTDIVPLSL